MLKNPNIKKVAFGPVPGGNTMAWSTFVEYYGIKIKPYWLQVDRQILTKLLAGQLDPEHRYEFLPHYPHPHKKENNYFRIYRGGKWKVHYEYLTIHWLDDWRSSYHL